MVEFDKSRFSSVCLVYEYSSIDLTSINQTLDSEYSGMVNETEEDGQRALHVCHHTVEDRGGPAWRIMTQFLEDGTVMLADTAVNVEETGLLITEYMKEFKSVIQTVGLGDPESKKIDVTVEFPTRSLDYSMDEMVEIAEDHSNNVEYHYTELNEENPHSLMIDVEFEELGETVRLLCLKHSITVNISEVPEEYDLDSLDALLPVVKEDLSSWLETAFE